ALVAALRSTAMGHAEAVRSQDRALAALAGGTVEDTFPLAPIQEGILLKDLFEGGVQTYLVQAAWRVPGWAVDVIEGPWVHLLRTEPVLRTGVLWEEVESPVQVVLADVDAAASWRHVDGSDWDDRPDHRSLREWMVRAALDRLDPQRAPLTRLA